MKTANLENCRKLYELTGWWNSHLYWHYGAKSAPLPISPGLMEWSTVEEPRTIHEGEQYIPAYDLNCLVESTPFRSNDDITHTFMLGRNTDNTGWSAVYKNWVCIAQEPEDAVCELLIKIYERNV